MMTNHIEAPNRKRNEAPTLSLCMVVRDEEKFLPKCLESVKGVVHEKIIVDTGSSDRTVEIAESHGARVLIKPWEGDFAEAMNYGLQYATGEWILHLDADEELVREDIPLLWRALGQEEREAIYVTFLNDTPDGWTKHYFPRIFRRGRAFYRGNIHSQLVYDGPDLLTEIRIRHWGYNLSPEKMDAKCRFTEKLLLRQLEKNHADPNVRYHYVHTLKGLRNYQGAVEEGFRALEICGDALTEPTRQMILYDMAICMAHTDRNQEAEQICREVLEQHQFNLDVLFTLGVTLINQHKYREAIDVMKDFIVANEKERNKPGYHLPVMETYDFANKAYANVAECWLELGDMEAAENAIHQALALRPGSPDYQVIQARVLLGQGRTADAREILFAADEAEQTDPSFYLDWFALSKHHSALGDPIEIIERGLEKYPDTEALQNAFGYTIFPNNPLAAEHAWQKTLELNPGHIGAHAGLAKIYAEQNRIEDLEKRATYVLENAKEKDVLKAVGGYCLYAQCYSTALHLFSKYLTLEQKDPAVLTGLATCLTKTGDHEAARSRLQEVRKLSPDNPMTEKSIEILENLLRQEK